MSRKRATRICVTDGCGATIGAQGKTGMCRPCAIAANHADPAYRKKLAAGRRAFLENTEAVAARQAKMLEGAARFRANMTRAQRKAQRDHGKWLYRTHAAAYCLSQEQRQRGADNCAETKLSWCPPDRREEYRRLVRRRIPAAEARRIIEAEIPGTREHARREIDSIELAARLRRERDRQDAY